MEDLIGTSLPVFFTVTVALLGFTAYMTGQAVANGWHPAWQVVVYCFLLGLASRFLTFALFDGTLLTPVGYLIDVAVLIAIASFAYRVTRARRMTSQYPWLYERVGLFGWRARH